MKPLSGDEEDLTGLELALRVQVIDLRDAICGFSDIAAGRGGARYETPDGVAGGDFHVRVADLRGRIDAGSPDDGEGEYNDEGEKLDERNQGCPRRVVAL